MRSATVTPFVAKMSGSTKPIFPSLDVGFAYSKSSLSSWTYILVFTTLTRNNVKNITAITRQATSNTVHSYSNLKFIIRYNSCRYQIYHNYWYNFPFY